MHFRGVSLFLEQPSAPSPSAGLRQARVKAVGHPAEEGVIDFTESTKLWLSLSVERHLISASIPGKTL